MPFTPTPVAIRPARPSDEGVEFVDYLHRRCGGDRRLRERMMVFIQQWDHLADDLGEEPTAEQYATRWRVSPASTYRLLDEFRHVFPGERSPGRLLGVLWEGLGDHYRATSELGSLLNVRIMEQGQD